MKQFLVFAIILSVRFGFAATPSVAEPVFIEAGSSVGQGFVFETYVGCAVYTAYHVVSGADQIVVTNVDGRSQSYSLYAADEDRDIAVLLPEEWASVSSIRDMGCRLLSANRSRHFRPVRIRYNDFEGYRAIENMDHQFDAYMIRVLSLSGGFEIVPITVDKSTNDGGQISFNVGSDEVIQSDSGSIVVLSWQSLTKASSVAYLGFVTAATPNGGTLRVIDDFDDVFFSRYIKLPAGSVIDDKSLLRIELDVSRKGNLMITLDLGEVLRNVRGIHMGTYSYDVDAYVTRGDPFLTPEEVNTSWQQPGWSRYAFASSTVSRLWRKINYFDVPHDIEGEVSIYETLRGISIDMSNPRHFSPNNWPGQVIDYSGLRLELSFE